MPTRRHVWAGEIRAWGTRFEPTLYGNGEEERREKEGSLDQRTPSSLRSTPSCMVTSKRSGPQAAHEMVARSISNDLRGVRVPIFRHIPTAPPPKHVAEQGMVER